LGIALLDEPAHEADRARAVRAAVAKITNEDEPALGMMSFRVVAEHLQQVSQRGEFPVNVTDDINRTRE
jgi:hypothetical protein